MSDFLTTREQRFRDDDLFHDRARRWRGARPMTAEFAALLRIAGRVHGQPPLEDAEPDEGFTAAQLRETQEETAPTDAARAAAEAQVDAYRYHRGMGRSAL